MTDSIKKSSIYPIKLKKHNLTDTATGLSRPIHPLRGPVGQPHRLRLFLDGELYWREMKAVPVGGHSTPCWRDELDQPLAWLHAGAAFEISREFGFRS